ncbi:thermonuclease family protein [Shimia abyssi]|uniref:Nuclease-like protein n=1 Tax=Shimia abyssi TaxID=1662395 RepID=A0A2P8FFN6_9RHOB|nr:thermonuclease family protein [Shimia abyssi]PSL20530.1 nuclease-like protein [Shimia abyssi]
MEVIFGLIVLAGAIRLIVVAARRNDVIEPYRPRRREPSVRKPRTAAKRKPSRVSRFDDKHATHLPEPQVLSGAAWIIDGDTITIQKTQVRLFGIDAPELNHPYGQKAKWALHKLCKGQTIRAHVTDVDHHGRTVAKCYLPDGRDLSAEMVKMGMAIDWPKYSGKLYTHLETHDARKKLFLADARQKGRMDIWYQFERRQRQG